MCSPVSLTWHNHTDVVTDSLWCQFFSLKRLLCRQMQCVCVCLFCPKSPKHIQFNVPKECLCYVLSALTTSSSAALLSHIHQGKTKYSLLENPHCSAIHMHIYTEKQRELKPPRKNHPYLHALHFHWIMTSSLIGEDSSLPKHSIHKYIHTGEHAALTSLDLNVLQALKQCFGFRTIFIIDLAQWQQWYVGTRRLWAI